MNDHDKPAPESLDRPDPRAELSAALRRASEGMVDDDLAISLAVSGGVQEQRYQMEFRTRGGEIEECAIGCAMSDRRAQTKGRGVDPKLFADLSKKLLRSRVLELRQEPPRFLPDTLIGVITIQQGELEHRVFFAADPDQASVQGADPPKAVMEAAEALYSAAGAILQLDDVRP